MASPTHGQQKLLLSGCSAHVLLYMLGLGNSVKNGLLKKKTLFTWYNTNNGWSEKLPSSQRTSFG